MPGCTYLQQIKVSDCILRTSCLAWKLQGFNRGLAPPDTCMIRVLIPRVVPQRTMRRHLQSNDTLPLQTMMLKTVLDKQVLELKKLWHNKRRLPTDSRLESRHDCLFCTHDLEGSHVYHQGNEHDDERIFIDAPTRTHSLFQYRCCRWIV